MIKIIVTYDNGHPNLIRFRFHLIESHDIENTVNKLSDTNGNKEITNENLKAVKKYSQYYQHNFKLPVALYIIANVVMSFTVCYSRDKEVA